MERGWLLNFTQQDKNLGASLDRAARQALKRGDFEEAASLAKRAVSCFVQVRGREMRYGDEGECASSSWLQVRSRVEPSMKNP